MNMKPLRKQFKQAPGMRAAAKLLHVAWLQRPWAVTSFFVGALLETCAFIVSLYATAKLGGLLATYIVGGNPSSIWLWLVIDLCAVAVMVFANWVMESSKRLLYFRMVQWTSLTFFNLLCTIDIDDFYNQRVRTQIQKVQNGYLWQIPGTAESTLDLLYSLIRFLATALVVSQITWWLIPLIALFLIPSFLAERMLDKIRWYVWDQKGDNRHIFWGLEWIMRQPREQMELRSSQSRHYVVDKLRHLSHDFYGTQEKRYWSASKVVIPSRLLTIVGTAIGSIVLLAQFLQGELPLEQYFFLSGALLRIGSSLENIYGTLGRMQEPLLYSQSFTALINRKPTIHDKPHATAVKVNESPPRIEFRDVSFTYPGSSRPIFERLSFVIQPGEHIALVGQNGAGKSTIIKLLMRFYVPSSGSILIDGVDLNDIAIETWYAKIATLFQDFVRYPFSVRENVEATKPHNADGKLEEAAQLSSIEKMIHELPHGWDTVLDNSFENGIEPSGGQWQRVALARAFYRNAPVLILDEPTAAIDALAEYKIFNNIFEHYGNRTAIIVSHRFSTVRRAHRIIVLEHGKIAEQGSHTELIKAKGIYQDMFMKQAEGYQ